MGNTLRWMVGILATLAVVLPVAVRQPVAAGTTAVIDEATAASLCQTSYPTAPSGPEPLSRCQWDMTVIKSGPAAWAYATGRGVTVGVIDGGVDFTHPDLVGGIDVARSCSFIFSTTP